MAKDAYYFPHDSNAKDDPKCVLMIEQLGLESYGAYWVLVETLRDQPGYRYPLALIPALARRYNTTAQKLEAVVKSYGLFQTDGEDFFFSDSLNRRMESYDEKRAKASIAGRASAQKRLSMSTDVQQTLNGRSTTVQPEEKRREEERREEENREEENREEDIKDISSTAERIDYRHIIDLYHSACPSLPKIEKLTNNRKQAIKSAIKAHGDDVFEHLFQRTEASDFLTGRSGKWSSCNFDWIIKPANLVKVIEGTYDNKGYQPKSRYEESVLALHNWTPPEEIR